jgi:ABC-2 type transport system ATP-binding protein
VGVPVKQLSGGEQRRLDLAMAILGRPDVLILDEPATGLDPESRLCTWRLVRDLLESGTTEVLSTHNVAEAEELADRLAIRHRGRIVRAGTPAEVTASSPARVSFTLPPDTGDPVPDLPGAVRTEEQQGSAGREVLRAHQDVHPTLAALLGWASSHGVELTDLNARSASLEEALLAVAKSATGHTQDQEMTA